MMTPMTDLVEHGAVFAPAMSRRSTFRFRSGTEDATHASRTEEEDADL